ncbi:MAG: Ig-like domain-containing protein, partial [Puia sp.]|nr:Ig-like domain-containing protein [Puia sp.]
MPLPMKLSAKTLHSFLGCPGRRKFVSALAGLLLLTLGFSLQSVAGPGAGHRIATGTPGVPDVTNSNTQLIVTANFAIANGVAQNTVVAHIVDGTGAPVVDSAVTFTITGFGISPVIYTDGSGNATFSFSNTIAGNFYVTATVNVLGVGINQPIAFGGTNGKVTVTFVAGPVSYTAPSTYIIPTSTGAIADGVSQDGVKVHVTDANGNVIQGATVVFSIFSGTGTFVGTTTVTTDAAGVAAIPIVSTVAGQVDITATINGISVINGNTANVTFVAGPPTVSAPTTQLTEMTTGAVANGIATNSVNAHITDAQGNPVAGQAIIFAISSGTGTFVGTTTVTTDASGNASISLTSTVAGQVNVTATLNGNTLSSGVPPPNVVFVAGPPDVTNPSTTLVENTTGAVADGAATNSVKAHVVDKYGNPVANQAVTFAIFSGTGNFVGSATVTTDVNGNAIITLTSTVAGTVGITATVGGNAITNGSSPADVIFVAGPPSTSSPLTTLTENTTGAVADGVATNSVKAHIADAQGNPVANQTVTFAITSGTGTFVG